MSISVSQQVTGVQAVVGFRIDDWGSLTHCSNNTHFQKIITRLISLVAGLRGSKRCTDRTTSIQSKHSNTAVSTTNSLQYTKSQIVTKPLTNKQQQQQNRGYMVRGMGREGVFVRYKIYKNK